MSFPRIGMVLNYMQQAKSLRSHVPSFSLDQNPKRTKVGDLMRPGKCLRHEKNAGSYARAEHKEETKVGNNCFLACAGRHYPDSSLASMKQDITRDYYSILYTDCIIRGVLRPPYVACAYTYSTVLYSTVYTCISCSLCACALGQSPLSALATRLVDPKEGGCHCNPSMQQTCYTDSELGNDFRVLYVRVLYLAMQCMSHISHGCVHGTTGANQQGARGLFFFFPLPPSLSFGRED